MPARKRPIPVAAGADRAEAAAIDWSKFNWLEAERPFGRIPDQARWQIQRATNHFARLTLMEAAAPPMADAKARADELQWLATRLLNRIEEIEPTRINEKRPKNKVALAEFLSHRIRQHLRLPPGRNYGRAAIGADHLSILHESLRALDTSLRSVVKELAEPEIPERSEWHRWLSHISAALTDSGLPATTSNETRDEATPFMSLVRALLKVLPDSTSSTYEQKNNTALAKAIQRSRKAAAVSQ